MTASSVMRKNKDAVMSNCISSALASNRPYATSLRLAAEHFAQDAWLVRDIKIEDAFQYLKDEWDKIYSSADELNKMITRIRKTYVRPFYRTNAEFVRGEYDDDLGSVNELFETLRYVGQM